MRILEFECVLLWNVVKKKLLGQRGVDLFQTVGRFDMATLNHKMRGKDMFTLFKEIFFSRSYPIRFILDNCRKEGNEAGIKSRLRG